ncbi:MAG: tRNA uridine 5-carboxymethylaminomethyl modification enzyme MnmG [Thermoanaerobaculia bacterium]|nr:tRNA uridine 5-carboxymethylaminomethyl modification enzyme MnmG [Thermoanaerobaculia bacterium]
MPVDFEVIVVGAGHAGSEAALASARLGRRTLLVSGDLGTVARMSCNPAIGGLAKGQVVREIDALGGAMGLVADRTGIQFKVLNASRGPAVRGPRCQSDKARYSAEMRKLLDATVGLTLMRGTVSGFRIEPGGLSGLLLDDGSLIPCRAAVVTSGTFLRGLIHVGEERHQAGRWGEPPATTLSESLGSLGLRLGRMKTGTPPRLLRASLSTGRMEVASGDPAPVPFSFRSRQESFPGLPQMDCWLTHTSAEVHDLIRENLHHSPLYSGRITGRGPRYCPSIEDKVVRFPEKERHQIFVEPEGLDTDWMYLNGLSMSLPAFLQERIVRAIPGLEDSVMLRPAYAVEYDMVWPEQLGDTLEVRGIPGLFLAGQINGTSGYEEAAGQGLVAGTNAARRAAGQDEPFVLGRHEAYIGVMIDDLVTLGTDEPYRLLSSRAEHRLLLGADTAYARLTPLAVAAGLVSERDAEGLLRREERIREAREAFGRIKVYPDRLTQADLARYEMEISEESTVARLLKRPGLDARRAREWVLSYLAGRGEEAAGIDSLGVEGFGRILDELRYEGFVEKERSGLSRILKAQERVIPPGFAYRGMPGLSLEAQDKLERHRPRTLGQASRIPGVPPAAITLLLARLTLGNAAASGPASSPAGGE